MIVQGAEVPHFVWKYRELGLDKLILIPDFILELVEKHGEDREGKTIPHKLWLLAQCCHETDRWRSSIFNSVANNALGIKDNSRYPGRFGAYESYPSFDACFTDWRYLFGTLYETWGRERFGRSPTLKERAEIYCPPSGEDSDSGYVRKVQGWMTRLSGALEAWRASRRKEETVMEKVIGYTGIVSKVLGNPTVVALRRRIQEEVFASERAQELAGKGREKLEAVIRAVGAEAMKATDPLPDFIERIIDRWIAQEVEDYVKALNTYFQGWGGN